MRFARMRAQKLEALTSTVQAACHNSQARAFNARGQGRASDPLRPLQAESGPKVGTMPPVTGRFVGLMGVAPCADAA